MMFFAGSCRHALSHFHMLYGTAWKEDQTAELVTKAFRLGFRGVDTACQPKHYQEHLVGAALERMFSDDNWDGKNGGRLRREDVWIQTKFTSLDGQDKKRIPYNPKAPLVDQVRESVEVSRKNLRVDRIDSLVLHSPVRDYETTMTVWRAMEEAVDQEKVSYLGISNCYSFEFFKTLYQDAKHKPIVLQNRFYSDSGFDRELRAFCAQHAIRYQSFWTLTANPDLVHMFSKSLAPKYGVTPAQILYRYIIDTGGQPLSGCKQDNHISEAVAVANMTALTKEDIGLTEDAMYHGGKRRSRGEL